MTTLEIITLIVLGVAILALIIFYTIKAIRNKWLSKITSSIVEAMKEAEQSGKSGAEKLQYVLQKVEITCEELGIPFKLIKSLIIKFIEMTIKGYNNMIK